MLSLKLILFNSFETMHIQNKQHILCCPGCGRIYTGRKAAVPEGTDCMPGLRLSETMYSLKPAGIF